MERYDHIIIGGGIAGVTAAETIRGRDPDATVLIVGDERRPLYSRVLLPHVVRGKIAEEKVFLRPPGFYAEKHFAYASGVAATAIDTAARVVRLSDGTAAAYGRALLIATGGTPRKLACPGAEDAEPLYFQTLDDARRLIAASGAREAVVYGGGFIGLEFLMSFAHLGARATSVVRGGGFFSRTVDPRGVNMVGEVLGKNGITLRTGTEIAAIEPANGRKRAHLTRGGTVECDAVAVGIGLGMNVGLLEGSGVRTGYGVLTDGNLRTSAPDVFAAGDIAEHPDPFAGASRAVGNWQNALFQGKVAGVNMTGGDQVYDLLTSYSISCFGLPIVFVGAVEISDAARVVRSGSPDASLQLLVKGGRVIAATNVGPFGERAAVMKLITSKQVLSPSETKALGDDRTPLAAICH